MLPERATDFVMEAPQRGLKWGLAMLAGPLVSDLVLTGPLG